MCVVFIKQQPAYEYRISDWSSDVCSSDLLLGFLGAQQFVLGLLALRHVAERPGHAVDMAARVAQAEAARVDPAVGAVVAAHAVHVVIEIGRASCRERVWQYV